MKIHQFLCVLFLVLILFSPSKPVLLNNRLYHWPLFGKGDVKAMATQPSFTVFTTPLSIFAKDTTIITAKNKYVGKLYLLTTTLCPYWGYSTYREYQFGKYTAKKIRVCRQLNQGWLSYITGLSKENASNYQVNTPVAIAVQEHSMLLFIGGATFSEILSGTPCMKTVRGFVCLIKLISKPPPVALLRLAINTCF